MKNNAFCSADILLPKGVDMAKWSVIACDQFTSERSYWEQLDSYVGNEKSTLRLVLPEIYLNDRFDERMKNVNSSIAEYLDGGVFDAPLRGWVLVIRSTPFVKRRIGIVGAIDLECYDYSKGSRTAVRATEGTIVERIPPRLKIREQAALEFPHIMVLFSDAKRQIAEELYERRASFKKLYDFELNMGGGHIEGYYIPESEGLDTRLSELPIEAGCDADFRFAVGDGNHSLATAKAHWEKIKAAQNIDKTANHPARYALCELVNIYDEGIYFEPIHRYVTGACGQLAKRIAAIGANCSLWHNGTSQACNGELSLPESIRAVDVLISEHTAETHGKVDYIHGDEHLKALVGADELGIMFGAMDKSELFGYVSKYGALPRKTFSMGEGVEKRYYLEGRRIEGE